MVYCKNIILFHGCFYSVNIDFFRLFYKTYNLIKKEITFIPSIPAKLRTVSKRKLFPAFLSP